MKSALVCVCVCLALISGCGYGEAPSSGSAKYVKLSESNFEEAVLKNPKPVLVDFGATWCEPCRGMEPVIAELAAEFEGRATVGKVDIDSEPSVAAKYDIGPIPAFLFFKNGKVVDGVIGGTRKRVLAAKLSRLLSETRE
ncbi:MAG: thioredoxin [Planctomycetes bacterium]|nr:thioredoxin [Planctomycetota bacterium]